MSNAASYIIGDTSRPIFALSKCYKHINQIIIVDTEMFVKSQEKYFLNCLKNKGLFIDKPDFFDIVQ